MENENENLFESVLTEEETQAFDGEFDDGVTAADEDFDLSDDQEKEDDQKEGETDAEAESETEPEPEKAGEDDTEDEPREETGEQKEKEPEPQKGAEDQRFTLKVNGAESEVSREEVIALAQKGMDYDRIKAERDSFKADAPTMQRYKEQETFLKDLADKSGITVDALMENVRVRMAMDQDKNLTEDQARAKVKADAAARQQPAEEKVEEKAKEPSPEERRQAMFASFVRAYPDVKADSIPKEVWETAGRTFDLVGAYRDHEIRTLRKEVETLRQNNKNKERSTGSRKSVGATTPKDPFDEAWDSV
jgi:hypothetical protein